MRIGIVGLGLIGGSAALAWAEQGHEVLAYDIAQPQAPLRGIELSHDLDQLLSCDVCVLAVPLPVLPRVLPTFAHWAGILTDVTSVKQPVLDLVGSHCSEARFVGGHPMAGKETAGFSAADGALFHGCPWVLTSDNASAETIETVSGLVNDLGARIMVTSARRHDQAVARISHLPHVLAVALQRAGAADSFALQLAAGSFRDGTRVASSPVELIAAMCAGNATALQPVMDEVIADLQRARAALNTNEPEGPFAEWIRDTPSLRFHMITHCY